MEPSSPVKPLSDTANVYIFQPYVKNIDERVEATFSHPIPTPSDLDQISFDVWKYDAVHFKHFFVAMFQRLGILDDLRLEVTDLQRFVEVVHSGYRDNNFHNFIHAFTVAQMLYCFLVLERSTTARLTKREQFCLLVAGLCHDIDHPGVSNGYLSRSESSLAVLYNDKSVLESHHACCAWRIIAHPRIGLLRSITDDERRDIRANVVCLILSTDMALHFNFIREMEQVRDKGLDWEDASHRRLLLQLLIKCADISNEVRPSSVSRPWADCLIEEFAAQSELERKNEFPLTPWMVKGRTPLHTTQINFIDSCIIPVFKELSHVLTSFAIYLEKLDEAKEIWAKLGQST